MLLWETKYRGCWLLAAKLSQIGAYHLTPLLLSFENPVFALNFLKAHEELSWSFFPHTFPQGH